ncbi:MAG: Rv1355c family protein [Mycobacterium sp.]|nr:Rv1355c family protein [Mycobacterium sp.]
MHLTEPDTSHSAQLLDPEQSADRAVLQQLRATAGIAFLDHFSTQLAGLRTLRPAPDPDLLSEPQRWAYYPWRRTVVGLLGPRGFRALRLDRNRNNITRPEQDSLGTLTIGVAGLSVGHVIAHTLAAQGICGRLRLADFDELELSNLNRVPATVFDLGVNKSVVAARRIAELDPYLPVEVVAAGLTIDSLDLFLDGLDIAIEECDALDMKALLRVGARDRRIPVVMATSDRGIVDVERFDREPQRPILHGLLGQLDIDLLPGMSSREKVSHVLRHLEAERLSPRTAASLVEIDRTISTWPQLASDVIVGSSAVAEAVRRIGLGEELRSGRCRIDVGSALDQLEEPQIASRSDPPPSEEPANEPLSFTDISGDIVAAAMRAPSGGNVQPWHIDVSPAAVTIRIDPAHTSTLDVAFRASAVAVGAAVYNARIAAASCRVLGPISITDTTAAAPLVATVHLGEDYDAELADLYPAMLARVTNRHQGKSTPLPDETLTSLTAAAEREGARLQILSDRDDIAAAATILAAADRTRYLTPQLHGEMIAELRWPGDPDPHTGIDVRSLELDAGSLTVLQVLRRPDVMAELASWGAGSALGEDTRDRVLASSALAVVTVTGASLRDYARGGSAVEAVWIEAQRQGFGVQPISPAFLYAHGSDDLHTLSATFANELGSLQSEFASLTRTAADESIALVLRLAETPPASVPTLRSLSRIALPPS